MKIQEVLNILKAKLSKDVELIVLDRKTAEFIKRILVIAELKGG